MKERASAFWESIKAFWGKLSRKARIVLLGGSAAVVVLILVLVVLLNQKNYVLLYNDLSTPERAEALTVLAGMNIDARLEPSGAIMVPENDVNRAHMQLATQGFPGNAFNYDIATPGLTATQSDKNRLEKYQLQDRLQATIESFDEVSQAVVTISMPEKSSFALATDITPPSASVTITRRPGRDLSAEQIRGIINVVKDSVPGLDEANISITDSRLGDLKSSLALGADVNNAKLRLTEEVNNTLRGRILSMVQPRYGAGNVEVAVNSVLDTNSRTAETIQYNPYDETNPQYHPYDYTEHDRQKVGTGTGIAEGVPGANDNVGTPQYGQEDQTLADTANYSTHDIYDYLVGSTKEQIVKEGLDIVDTTVAVVINRQTLPEGEKDQIAAIVANATGIPIEIVTDKVTVQNFEFEKAADIPADTIIQRMDPRSLLLLAGLIALLLVIIAVVVIVVVGKRKQQTEEEDEYSDLQYDENGVPLIDLMNQEEDFDPIPIVETQEQKLRAQIKDLADSDPEIVAQLIKTWLVNSK